MKIVIISELVLVIIIVIISAGIIIVTKEVGRGARAGSSCPEFFWLWCLEERVQMKVIWRSHVENWKSDREVEVR